MFTTNKSTDDLLEELQQVLKEEKTAASHIASYVENMTHDHPQAESDIRLFMTNLPAFIREQELRYIKMGEIKLALMSKSVPA